MMFTRRTRDLGWALTIALLEGCAGSETAQLGQTQEAAITDRLKATIQQTTSWGTGYCANVNITNLGPTVASTWTVVLELNQASIYTSWNGVFNGAGSRKTVTPIGWNATVLSGATQSFGYCANTTGPSHAPQVIGPPGSSAGNGGSSGSAAGGNATGGNAAGGNSAAGDNGGMGGDSAGGHVAGGGSAGGEATGGHETGGNATGGNGGPDAGATGGNAVSGPDAGATGGNATGASGGASGNAAGGNATGGNAAIGGGSGYTPTSEFLLHPERAIPVLTSLADFRVRARDDNNGGFFTFVNSDGYVSTDRRKGFVTLTRDAWAFSRAFMVSGDDKYLDHAAYALEHLHSHGWDNAQGGWYFTGDEYGNLTPYSTYWDPNTWKWSFVQHYALLGMGAYCDAARDADACNWLKKGRSFLDARMWDSSAARVGYYEQANLDMSNPRSKGFTSTVDALTTNGIQVELLWPTAAYHQRMVDLANIVVDRLAANMDLSSARFAYPENYSADWAVDTSQTGGDVGHVLKSAWVLARAYLRHPDGRYRTAARKLIYEVLNNGGWDETNGVPYTRYNWSTGQITKEAECWQIEQAITSGLSNSYIADNQTDRDAFLKMADRALQFFYKYVIDHAHGGTYKMNSVTGAPTDASKSNFFNVEYHSTETFYFTYLYGSLMLQRIPVALYYRVPPSTSQQIIQLNPVAIDDASLQIQSVTLDGQLLATFSGSTREVTLAAGQGGKLRVVFAPQP